MDQKEELVVKLNDLIFNFENSSEIVNYAIIFEDQIILSPSATYLNNQKVLDILKKLNIEKLEEIFQQNIVKLIHLEFEDEIICYSRGKFNVRVVISLKKDKAEGVREKLLNFVEQISSVMEPISEFAVDDNENIQQAFAALDTLINEFKVPKFERFNKLVKFAIPFKKK